MNSLLLLGLTITFLVESLYEMYQYLSLKFIAQHAPHFDNHHHLPRILQIEQAWNWLSWLLFLLFIILSQRYSILLISILTTIETVMVFRVSYFRHHITR